MPSRNQLELNSFAAQDRIAAALEELVVCVKKMYGITDEPVPEPAAEPVAPVEEPASMQDFVTPEPEPEDKDNAEKSA